MFEDYEAAVEETKAELERERQEQAESLRLLQEKADRILKESED